MSLFTTRRRVEFRDTDAAGIVHFSAFFFWMESAEHELLRTVGVRVVDHDASGVETGWPRVAASCEYTAAVRFGDEIEVGVAVEEVGRSSVTYRFRFVHGSTTVASGRVVAVRCLMHSDRKPEPVAIPDDIVTRLVQYRGA
jgi:acyl-CoA thioester hydrolase